MAQFITSKPARRGGSVLVVGLGALGCPAASVLARAGNVDLGLVDPDRVELSNLQRQVLFGDGDIGRPKAHAAAAALVSRGAEPRIEAHALRFDDENCRELFGGHDIVLDCCDDSATKSLINKTALATGTPYVHAGVARTYGQLMTVLPGVSACLTCAFGSGSDRRMEGCSELGILAPVAGLIGSLQALEALRYLNGRQPVQAGVLKAYELKPRRWRRIRFERDRRCPDCCEFTIGETPRRVEPCRL